jgi:cyclopropane-fatty-acyl-phospholipid synthase
MIDYSNIFLRMLSRIRVGALTLTLPDGKCHRFGDRATGFDAEMRFTDTQAIPRILLNGDIGLGETYMEGLWHSPDLTAVLRLFIDNRKHLGAGKLKNLARLAQSLVRGAEWIRHRLNSNNRKNSRRNIHAHYDLGNDFYRLFLDSTMTYSSAFFEYPEQSLEDAQSAKYDRLCRKLNLESGIHLLEIGSGWGGMAIHAAKNYGCRVTTVTISEEQFAYAKERVKKLNLDHLIEVKFCDYRDLKGQYDRIVSIEMIEAVGHEHLHSYFSQCSRLLSPGGLIAIQGILSPNSRYQFYRRRSDYIRKHIFPGGHLPSIGSVQEVVARVSDWDLLHLETFGMHYAETLRRWRRQFIATTDARRKLGFDEVFDRKWEFYFCYCEAGFDSRHIQVAQWVMGAPNNTNYAFELQTAAQSNDVASAKHN